MLASIGTVDVVNVNTRNSNRYRPTILERIDAAHFVALDMEYSGLGRRRKFCEKDSGTRYNTAKSSAKEHCILALGISCFRQLPELSPARRAAAESHTCQANSDDDEIVAYDAFAVPFAVSTFNITTILDDTFHLDPDACEFLARNNFNLNYPVSHGIAYRRHRFSEDGDTSGQHQSLPSEIVHRIMKARVPLVMHNGFWDSLFLYENFYGPLPATLGSFLADMSDLFRGGLYDSKLVAQEWSKLGQDFLEYCFKKASRVALYSELQRRRFACIESDPIVDDDAAVMRVAASCAVPSGKVKIGVNLCAEYASRGFCRRANVRAPEKACELPDDMHSVDRLLAHEEQCRRRSRKKRRGDSLPPVLIIDKCNKLDDANATVQTMASNNGDNPAVELGAAEQVQSSDSSSTVSSGDIQYDTSCSVCRHSHSARTADSSTVECNGAHAAGYDAFMTGYVLAAYLADTCSPERRAPRATDGGRNHFERLQLRGREKTLLRNRIHFAANPTSKASSTRPALAVEKSQYIGHSRYHRLFGERVLHRAISPD